MIIRPGYFYEQDNIYIYYVVDVYRGNPEVFFGESPIVFSGFNVNIYTIIYDLEVPKDLEQIKPEQMYLKGIIKKIFDANPRALMKFNRNG